MHDDLPPKELQDLHPAPANLGFPERWARAVNRACTAWLLKRGLLDPDSFNAPTAGNGTGPAERRDSDEPAS